MYFIYANININIFLSDKKKMDNKLIKQLQNSIKNRRLFIGGSMVLDPDFDIKNYLPDFQKQKELEKIIFNAKKPLPNINILLNLILLIIMMMKIKKIEERI